MMEIEADNRECWTVDAEEGASLLGIGRTLFLEMNVTGKLPAPIPFNRAVRWIKDELHDWLLAKCPSRERWVWPKCEGK